MGIVQELPIHLIVSLLFPVRRVTFSHVPTLPQIKIQHPRNVVIRHVVPLPSVCHVVHHRLRCHFVTRKREGRCGALLGARRQRFLHDTVVADDVVQRRGEDEREVVDGVVFGPILERINWVGGGILDTFGQSVGLGIALCRPGSSIIICSKLQDVSRGTYHHDVQHRNGGAHTAFRAPISSACSRSTLFFLKKRENLCNCLSA